MQTIIETPVGASHFRVNGAPVLMVEIQDNTGQVTHQVSANAVLKMLRDVEHWQKLSRQFEEELIRERNRIRRLMACLTDEVLES